jgi:hypothetical protein
VIKDGKIKEKIASFLFTAMVSCFYIAIAIISAKIYSLITGGHLERSSVGLLIPLVLPFVVLIGLVLCARYFRGVTSLKFWLIYTIIWFLPSLLWLISFTLKRYGWDLAAHVVYEWRYAALLWTLIGIGIFYGKRWGGGLLTSSINKGGPDKGDQDGGP